MDVYKTETDPYNLDTFENDARGLGWDIDTGQVAVLIHDLIPYYTKVLDPGLEAQLIEANRVLIRWAYELSIPVIASAPRPATDIRERGLGGTLWGIGPSYDDISQPCIEELSGLAKATVYKRSLSAFYATDLEVELKRLGKSQLLTAGVFASGGILATSIDALARDIKFFCLADAVADTNIEKHRFALTYIAETSGQIVSLKALPRI
ncbi:isochorismatase family protein [Rothia sp. CCM 9417]|uniref:isochorismatase family protein n=1 Tax=unclassified Rothia (in: high G+C Gram-positive bacteria) TaxID=2689056 RepID=UPI003AE05655